MAAAPMLGRLGPAAWGYRDAFAARLAGLVAGCKVRGLSQRAMVEEFNLAKVHAPAEGKCQLVQMQRLLSRISAGSRTLASYPESVPAISNLLTYRSKEE